ncbi:glycosyltransferase family A protein [Flavobacterium sp.]|uniref:glycosyltransferase family 2 protein n=1 Tax=Flavobacterium sp. TaxID=239 RepID=UPI0028BE05E9|nr:glycosyltransferase family A protein [Flavobacterium sp.]
MSFFSVIIPLFNKERYIQNTINSVLRQSFQDFEIILVEDCSTDSSLTKASAINSEKIKIIRHQENKGLSASRNTGIKNANGKYIAFLDADDLWEINFLEEIQTLIHKFPEADLFATNYQEIFPNKTSIIPANNSDKLEVYTIVPNFFKISLAQPLYCPSSLCVQKSIFESIGYYDENITYGEDVDFNIRINSKLKLAYSTNPLVKYFTVTENQITQSKLSNKKITDFDKYDGKETSSEMKKYLDFNRYIMAKHYILENNSAMVEKMKKGLNMANLNYKQRILINSPKLILILIKKIRSVLLSKGIRLTTYD